MAANYHTMIQNSAKSNVKKTIIFLSFAEEDRDVNALRKKYGNSVHFQSVKINQDGSIHFPQKIGPNTKIIICGHGLPQGNCIASGNGQLLHMHNLASVIATNMAAGQTSVDISFNSCYSGCGSNVNNHNNSIAGNLYSNLVPRDIKPTISAKLVSTKIDNYGRRRSIANNDMAQQES